MTTTLEQVTRAMARVLCPSFVDIDRLFDSANRDAAERQASVEGFPGPEAIRLATRAAVEAMREPSREMITAGDRKTYEMDRFRTSDVYRAMIDAILNVPVTEGEGKT